MSRPRKTVSIYAAQALTESLLRMAFDVRGFRVVERKAPCDVGVVIAETDGDGAEEALRDVAGCAQKTLLVCLRKEPPVETLQDSLLFCGGRDVPFADILNGVIILAIRKRGPCERTKRDLA